MKNRGMWNMNIMGMSCDPLETVCPVTTKMIAMPLAMSIQATRPLGLRASPLGVALPLGSRPLATAAVCRVAVPPVLLTALTLCAMCRPLRG